MKDTQKVIVISYNDATKYTLRAKNKRISLVNIKEDDSLIIQVKRLRKEFDKDGQFTSFEEVKGILAGQIRLTDESAKELFQMLYQYFLDKNKSWKKDL